MRVAVVGARGQLGAAVAQECGGAHETVTFSRAELDVTDDAAVDRAMAGLRPDVIVNGAAFTNVDAAEDHPVEALEINAFAVRALARAARAHGAMLVHYSSDFVFDGHALAPYSEEDRPGPRSVYAASKLLGEWFALDVPRAYVLRVESLFGRAPGLAPETEKGSLASIVKTLMAGGSARVFEDRTISPTYIVDAAQATRRLIEGAAPAGVYHCVNTCTCTWLEMARVVARHLGVPEMEARLVPVRMSDMTLKAARPRYCSLSNAKLRSAGIDMPTWQDSLDRYLTTLRHDFAN